MKQRPLPTIQELSGVLEMRTKASSSFRGLCCVLLVLLTNGVSLEAVTLVLKDKSAVTGKEYFVSDLVEIRDGIPPEILSVRMGSAPTFKEPALITQPMIEMAVKNQAKILEPISWEGAKSCIVSRPSRFVSTADLVAVITPALLRVTGGMGTVNIQEFAGLSPMEIPAGHAQGSVELNPSALINEWTNASVSFIVDGEIVLNRSIRFHWSWVRDVWISQKDLPTGSKIIPSDFRLVKTNALTGGDLLVSDPSQYSEGILAKPLKLGAVLTQEDIEQKKVVYKGGKVMVRYAVSGLEIKMIGVALQDGAEGATIRVMNTTSHVNLLARVIDKNNLEFVQTL